MNANKKVIQQKMATKSGNIVLLKDLSNIRTAALTSNSRNDLDGTIKSPRTNMVIILSGSMHDVKCMFFVVLGASVNVYSDKQKKFKGLFFQDGSMKQCFSSYTEIIYLDATYKLLQIGLPIYLLLCEDSNGLSEICLSAFL